MLTLSSRTKVSELSNGPAGVRKALLATGIFHEGDDPDIMLGELCWNHGLNPVMLLNILEAVNISDEVPAVNLERFQAMPLAGLVDHIQKDHHDYLRENLPLLVNLTSGVASAHLDDPNLVALDEEMKRIAGELWGHIHHEEESLFSMVRDLGSNRAVAPTRCGEAVGGPIACMENEHAATLATLQKLRQLTNGYTAPANAGSLQVEMLKRLAFFDQDLREHMYKEDKVLFPRALEAQRKLAHANSN